MSGNLRSFSSSAYLTRGRWVKILVIAFYLNESFCEFVHLPLVQKNRDTVKAESLRRLSPNPEIN